MIEDQLMIQCVDVCLHYYVFVCVCMINSLQAIISFACIAI